MPLPRIDSAFRDLCVAAVLVAAAALLAACGGSDRAAAEPLFDGHGRYATPAQYERERKIHRDRTVLIDLDAASADAAVNAALNIGYWHDQPAEVNFFIRSRDARAAAELADTLAAFGYLRVFVIV